MKTNSELFEAYLKCPTKSWLRSRGDTGGVNAYAELVKAHELAYRIERVVSEGRGRPAKFVPIRFNFRNKLTRDDRLLLAFDSLGLSELLGREVNLGKIIHGDEHTTLKVKTEGLLDEVRKLAPKMAEVATSASPPDLVLNRHCSECEFQDRCRQKALEKDDLSLLANMTGKERKKFHNKGIF